MPQLSGHPQVFHANTAIQDSSQQVPLGTRAVEANGNEWIYLRGTTAVIAGGWVLIGSAYVTSSAIADDQGRLAIAGTAHTANTFGWFQIYGQNNLALSRAAIAANANLYLTTVSGAVDDADVAGDAITGAVSLAANSGSTTLVDINYPFVHDAALD